MQIEIRTHEPADSPVYAEIFNGLPERFGLEESSRDFIDSLQRFTAFVATANDWIAGFLSGQGHNAATAEIYVMAAEEDLRRSGIGRQLIEHDRVKLGVEQAKSLARALRCHPTVLVFPGWDVEHESAA